MLDRITFPLHFVELFFLKIVFIKKLESIYVSQYFYYKLFFFEK